jgi:methionine aminopeptidase
MVSMIEPLINEIAGQKVEFLKDRQYEQIVMQNQTWRYNSQLKEVNKLQNIKSISK